MGTSRGVARKGGDVAPMGTTSGKKVGTSRGVARKGGNVSKIRPDPDSKDGRSRAPPHPWEKVGTSL